MNEPNLRFIPVIIHGFNTKIQELRQVRIDTEKPPFHADHYPHFCPVIIQNQQLPEECCEVQSC